MYAVMNVTRDRDGKWHPSVQDLTLRHSSMFNETIEKGKTTARLLKNLAYGSAKRKLISLAALRNKITST